MRRWWIIWSPPTRLAPRVPISASTFTSIAHSLAPGARANASTCRAHGNKVHQAQGYQLPLTPAQLYRAGIAATNAHCRKTYGRSFDRIEDAQREEVLIGLSTAKIKFDNGLPVRVFWATIYQTVIEGMYSDPIYGGNRNKAGWAIIGFPGIIAVHRDHVEKYRGKPFPNKPIGIADMS